MRELNLEAYQDVKRNTKNLTYEQRLSLRIKGAQFNRTAVVWNDKTNKLDPGRQLKTVPELSDEEWLYYCEQTAGCGDTLCFPDQMGENQTRHWKQEFAVHKANQNLTKI